jgi:hypothetical protein
MTNTQSYQRLNEISNHVLDAFGRVIVVRQNVQRHIVARRVELARKGLEQEAPALALLPLEDGQEGKRLAGFRRRNTVAGLVYTLSLLARGVRVGLMATMALAVAAAGQWEWKVGRGSRARRIEKVNVDRFADDKDARRRDAARDENVAVKGGWHPDLSKNERTHI